MTGRKTIPLKELPMRSPILGAMVFWLFLDRYSAPSWLYGVIGTVYVTFFIVWAFDMCQRTDVSVLEGK
jgi:hypothetical protein